MSACGFKSQEDFSFVIQNGEEQQRRGVFSCLAHKAGEFSPLATATGCSSHPSTPALAELLGRRQLQTSCHDADSPCEAAITVCSLSSHTLSNARCPEVQRSHMSQRSAPLHEECIRFYPAYFVVVELKKSCLCQRWEKTLSRVGVQVANVQGPVNNVRSERTCVFHCSRGQAAV